MAAIASSILTRRVHADPLGKPVGIQLYTVNEPMQTDAAGTLRQLKSIGYGEVESAGFGTLSAQEFGELIKDAGLVCPSAHLSFDPDNLGRAFDDAHALGATYAAKLGKREGELDFRASAKAIVDRIRAFDPWPGCSARLSDDALASTVTVFKIWKAEIVEGASAADDAGLVLGRAADAAVLVSTGDGVVALTELQKPGGKRQPARLFAADFGSIGTLRFLPPEPVVD